MQAKMILVLASLVLAPLAFAHTDQGGPGTPDFTCQAEAEWQVHDYAGANGRTVADISDNNLEECGTTYGLFIAGTPECREIEDRLGSGPGDPAWELFCNTDRPADYDGDLEFAIGGALLAVESGDGETSGSLVCLGTKGHHTADISVEDQVFGTQVTFTVGADASLVPPVPGEPDCGDNVTRPCQPPNSGLGEIVDAILALLQTGNCNPNDHLATCFSECTAPFGPGADGTYTVWVHPSLNGGPGIAGTPTGASHGHVLTGGGAPAVPCGSDAGPVVQPAGAGASITFGCGALRILTESIVQLPGPAPPVILGVPNDRIDEPVHVGPGNVASAHEWVIYPGGDGIARTYEYTFSTFCPTDGTTNTYTGTVVISV